MTYAERIKVEHPEKLNPCLYGGVSGCPGYYWEGAPNGFKDYYRCIGAAKCFECWNSPAPPRKAKVKRKERKASGTIRDA